MQHIYKTGGIVRYDKTYRCAYALERSIDLYPNLHSRVIRDIVQQTPPEPAYDAPRLDAITMSGPGPSAPVRASETPSWTATSRAGRGL